MATTNFGTFSVEVDGELWWATGDWEIDFGTPEKTPMMSCDGRLAGFQVEHRPPSAKGKALYASSVSLTRMAALKMATCQIKIGERAFVFRNAEFTSPALLTARSGEIDVTLTAETCEEM